MDINSFVQIISQVGFPIFCAIVMFVHLEKERTSHKEESDKWVEALNNNTNVISKLIEKLDE